MKSVYVMRCDFSRKDGINRVIADLAYAFQDRLVLCVAKYDPSAAFTLPEDVRVVKFEHRACNSFFLLGLGVSRLLNLVRVLNKENKDIVLCTHGMADIIHASVLKGLLFSKNVHISAFVYDKDEFSHPFSGNFLHKANLVMLRNVVTLLIKLGFVKELLVLSSEMQRFFHAAFRTDKIRVLRLGVSYRLVSLSDEQDNLTAPRLFQRVVGVENCFRIFFAGVLTPHRRIEDLLRALKSLIDNRSVNPHLFVGGALDFPYTYAAAVKKLIHQLDLDDRVHFLGVLTDEELAFMYKNCDAFVWPGDQSWGLAPLEAMLFGTPAIVSAGNGVSEVLNESVAIVTLPHDPSSIESAIMTLTQDDEYRKALGLRAQHFVKERLTFASTANELTRVWQLDD